MSFHKSILFIYFVAVSFSVWLLEEIIINDHDSFGRLDSLSLSLLVLIFGYTTFNLLGRWAVIIITLATTFLLFFTFLSHQFFLFFGGYIGYEQLFMFKDLWLAFDKFPVIYFIAAIVFIVTSILIGWKVITCSVYEVEQQSFSKKWSPIAILSILFITVVFAHSHRYDYKAHWVNQNLTYDYKMENPVMFMLRSFPVSQQYLDNFSYKKKAALQTLATALIKGIEVDIPSIYHFSNFESLLLDYPNFSHSRDANQPLLYLPDENVHNKGNKGSTQPNVILIVLESIRAYETELFNQKVNLTPNLTVIAKEAVVATKFYSNSRTTVQAEQAILCSALDFASKSPYSVMKGEFNGKCLPKILSQNGYETFWYHGFTKTFFNRGVFHPSLGFNKLFSKEEFIKQGYEEALDIGWGVPDTITFKKLLTDMVSFEKNTNKPFFAQVLTLTNHQPFNWNYPDLKFPTTNKSKNSVYNQYLKGIYYTDAALGEFWRDFNNSPLKSNTILVITGDHGVPFYPDDINTPLLQSEVLYRVPLIIVTPDRRAEIIDTELSHLDLAPTLLSMLSIIEPVSFIGRPFLGVQATLAARPIYKMNIDGYSFQYKDLECFPERQICQNNKGECQKYNHHYCITDDKESFNIFKQSSSFMNYLELAIESGYVSGAASL